MSSPMRRAHRTAREPEPQKDSSRSLHSQPQEQPPSRQKKQKQRLSPSNRQRENSERRNVQEGRGNSTGVTTSEGSSTASTILGRSNLDCFLDHTTPAAQCQYAEKTSIRDASSTNRWRSCDTESMPYFTLGDLWTSFDEWSAYGAGVPLSLPSGETIVQYYVPYLSALQIYLRPGCSLFSKHRRLGDDSDLSDGGDMRDTSSEFSSDNENDKASRFLRREAKPGERTMAWDTPEDSDRSSVEETSQRREQNGDLIFEYFERCSPYGRAPLVDKISELATEFPNLRSLRSNDLSSASWVSVAWYPIYRIPTGPTMRDLATCFLTFHSLWTPAVLQDETIGINTKMESEQTCPWNVESDQGPIIPSPNRIDSERIELPAFGLASYKLRGPFWASAACSDRRRASSLASSADSWLKQLQVQHPDFDFFVSRGAIGKQ